MITHACPVRGRCPECGAPEREIEVIATDWETPSCGLPVVEAEAA